MGSQGLFKSPWILLNSPNFYNFAVAFATAMSTLLLVLGDCPYIYSCTVLRSGGGAVWQDWKLSLASAQQILRAENRTSADLGRAAYLAT